MILNNSVNIILGNIPILKVIYVNNVIWEIPIKE